MPTSRQRWGEFAHDFVVVEGINYEDLPKLRAGAVEEASVPETVVAEESMRDMIYQDGASVVFAHVAYRGSVRNMKEWRNSVRALVNLGRADVADGLGMALPRRLEDEKKMWYAVRGVYLYQDEAWKPWLDVFRRSQERRHPLP